MSKVLGRMEDVMLLKEFKKIEKDLKHNKKRNLDILKQQQNAVFRLKREYGSSELQLVKVFYEGKLTGDSYYSNSLGIMAIMCSLISLLISIGDLKQIDMVGSGFLNILLSLFFVIIFLVLLLIVLENFKRTRKQAVYTLIIQLINKALNK